MTIKIGEDLKNETIKKRGKLVSDTYNWLTTDRIFVNNDIF